LAPAVQTQIERRFNGQREDVVIERIVIREGNRGADRDYQNMRRELLLLGTDLGGDGRCGDGSWGREPSYGLTDILRWAITSIEYRDPSPNERGRMSSLRLEHCRGGETREH
jgi:hypothetical protein